MQCLIAGRWNHTPWLDSKKGLLRPALSLTDGHPTNCHRWTSCGKCVRARCGRKSKRAPLLAEVAAMVRGWGDPFTPLSGCTTRGCRAVFRRCTPQKHHPISRSSFLQPKFVVQPAANILDSDPAGGWQLMALNCQSPYWFPTKIWNAWPQAGCGRP